MPAALDPIRCRKESGAENIKNCETNPIFTMITTTDADGEANSKPIQSQSKPISGRHRGEMSGFLLAAPEPERGAR